MQIFEENTRRVGGLTYLKKSYMLNCEPWKSFLAKYAVSRLWRKCHLEYMNLWGKYHKIWGIELFGEIGHVGLRGPKGVSFGIFTLKALEKLSFVDASLYRTYQKIWGD